MRARWLVLLLVAGCDFVAVQLQRPDGSACDNPVQCAGGACERGMCCAVGVSCPGQGGAGAGGSGAGGDPVACGDGDACAEGFCVDGVCCNQACEGACETCTSAGNEGTCVPLAKGAPEPSCAPYVCDGQGVVCPSSCTDDDDCGGTPCLAGVCREVVDVAAGSAHTCAALSDGSVWCWGENSDFQLGVQTQIDSHVPAQVQTDQGALAGVVQVGLGRLHSCARLESGEVWCWGNASNMEVGNPGRSGNAELPVKVTLVSDTAIDLAVGARHSCAILQGGALWCWGENASGQAGVDSAAQAVAPGPVGFPAGSSVVAVGAGDRHTCAVADHVDTGMRLYCWGGQANGKLGDGQNVINGEVREPIPAQQADGLALAGPLALGHEHTCVLTGDGHVWCVGSNTSGQLGNTVVGGDELDFVEVIGADTVGMLPLDGIAGLTAHYDGTCAWGDGSAWCWGDAQHGELGDGSSTGERANAELVQLEPKVARVSGNAPFVNGNFVCAVAAGRAWCWGDNNIGQIGIDGLTEVLLPNQVAWPEAD